MLRNLKDLLQYTTPVTYPPPLSIHTHTHTHTHTNLEQNFQACVPTVRVPCPTKVLLINIIIVVLFPLKPYCLYTLQFLRNN